MIATAPRPILHQYRAAIIAATVWLGLVLAALCLRPPAVTGPAPPTCLFRAATGLPCPTCGATRAVEALAHGRIAAAAAFNPLLFGLGLAAAMLVSVRAVTGDWPARPAWMSGSAAWLLAAALLAANWVYLLLTDRAG